MKCVIGLGTIMDHEAIDLSHIYDLIPLLR